MKHYQPGEILLLSFPFTDAKRGKRRPALLLLDAGDEDVVVARITSQMITGSFDVPLSEWKQAGLLLPSVVRLHKLATLEKSLVERTLGKLDVKDWKAVEIIIRDLWTFQTEAKSR